MHVNKTKVRGYLARLFHFNGYDVVSIAAKLTGPRASLTDPL